MGWEQGADSQRPRGSRKLQGFARGRERVPEGGTRRLSSSGAQLLLQPHTCHPTHRQSPRTKVGTRLLPALWEALPPPLVSRKRAPSAGPVTVGQIHPGM